MKALFIALATLCVAVAFPAAAQSAADTIPGQAQLVRLLSTSLCTRIKEAGRSKPLAELSSRQADELFMQLMMESMGDHPKQFASLIIEGQQRKKNIKVLGRNLGEAAVMQLGTECPESMTLIMRTSSAQGELSTRQQKSANDISAEERTVLQPLADTACARLAAEDARRPLKQRKPKERSQVMTTIMQTAVLVNMPSLQKVYSAEQLSRTESMEALGIKMGILMITQCPTYLIMLGQDAK